MVSQESKLLHATSMASQENQNSSTMHLCIWHAKRVKIPVCHIYGKPGESKLQQTVLIYGMPVGHNSCMFYILHAEYDDRTYSSWQILSEFWGCPLWWTQTPGRSSQRSWEVRTPPHPASLSCSDPYLGLPEKNKVKKLLVSYNIIYFPTYFNLVGREG